MCSNETLHIHGVQHGRANLIRQALSFVPSNRASVISFVVSVPYLILAYCYIVIYNDILIIDNNYYIKYSKNSNIKYTISQE